MSNNPDAWILEKQILCRQYISSKMMNAISCRSKRSIAVRSYDKRLVIYEDNVHGDEGCGQLGWSCCFPREGASGDLKLI